MKNMKESIINLYPSTKFFVALFLGISPYFVPNYWFAIFSFLCCVIIAWICDELETYIKTIRNSLLILMIFMFLIRLFFSDGENIIFEIGNITATTEGLNLGLLMSTRVLALGGALLLFFQLTPVNEIISALENFGMPPSGTYVVLSSLKMIPEMRRQSETIMDAQKTRGVETEGNLITRMKAFIPTLGPLVLSSITSTEERVITLESRAFSANVDKTRLFTVHKKPIDTKIQYVTFALFGIFIVGRILIWIL